MWFIRGFAGWRQYDGTTQEGGERPRRPFMRNAWPVHQWNRADVQSVGGGFVVVNESIRFYSSGSKDLPFGEKTAHYHSRGNKSTGMAYLRRDGFTSVIALSMHLVAKCRCCFDCTAMVTVCCSRMNVARAGRHAIS